MADRPVATARMYRVFGGAFGVATALFGGLAGFIAGERLGFGYRFDWYRYTAPTSFAQTELMGPIALLAAGIVLVLTPLAIIFSYRVWEHRLKTQRAPDTAAGARPRDAHLVFTTAATALAAAAFLAIAVYALLFVMGIDRVSRGGFRDIMTLAGAFAGFGAGYFAWAVTGDALGKGLLVTRPGENLIGRVSVLSARHARVVVALVIAGTVAAGYGVTFIDTDVDVADVLPRGNPNTAAAHNLSEKFKSSFTLQTTFMVRTAPQITYDRDDAEKLGPFRATTAARENISDEVYVRAIDEMVEYVLGLQSEGSPFIGTIALSDFFRIVNWTLAGGTSAPDEAFSMPPSGEPHWELLFATINRSVWAAIPETADAVISPDFRQSSVLFAVSPKETMSSKEIGQWALRARDSYVEWAEQTPTAYKVFTGDNAPIFSVDLPIANAHSSELASEDFSKLLPVIAVFILIALFIAFRNAVSIIVAFSMLTIAVIWTFGAMGFMRISLNTLNLTTLPLIMGVGIDYGIHMMNEYQEMRAKGHDAEKAWRLAGGGSALALFVATLTTTTGLLVMVVSPSQLVAELGILSAIAIVSCFILSVVFIPALTTALGGGVPRSGGKVDYRPSTIMPRLAQLVSRTRVLAVIIIAMLAFAAYSSAITIGREPFGDPPRNWLEGDSLRAEHEAAVRGFYASETDDIKANILIFEGDINDPAAHRYMDALEASLRLRAVNTTTPEGEEGRVIEDTLRTLPFLVRTYLTVRDGGPGAVAYLAQANLAERDPRADPYPTTREEIAAILDDIHQTPLTGLANLFFDNPDDSMAIMLFSVKAATFEDAEIVWNQVHAALADVEDQKPQHLQVAFFGNTAINYLFVAEEVPWLGYMSAATVVLVFTIVIAATRSVKLGIVVATANALTSLFWIGILPQVGIGLAITLTLPLVFIFAMGSDYTLHMALRCQKSKDTYETMATVGKGVLFSFVTTIGAFTVFTQISNLAVRKTMIATTIAIAVVMVTAVVLVPIFYPVRKQSSATGGDKEEIAAPEAKREPRVLIELPEPVTAKGGVDG